MSLDRRFAAFKRASPPDVWGDAVAREPSPRPRQAPRRAKQVLAAVTAFAVAIGIFAVLTRSFSGQPGAQQSVPPGGTISSLPPGLGGSLIVASGVGPQAELYRYDLATGTLSDLGAGTSPSVSPDGSQIAFRTGYRAHGVTSQQIAVVNIDGTNGARVLLLPPSAANDAGTAAGPPVWSPDGTHLAFASRAGIYTSKADGSDLQFVTASQDTSRVCADFQPSWSPDGGHLAFVVVCEDGSDGLWSIGVDGTGLQRLTSVGDHGIVLFHSPAWSPDGVSLAFEGVTKARNPHRFISNIYLRAVDGTLTQLTNCSSTSCFEPAWSPDGRWIAFAQRVAGIGVVSVDGSETVTLNPDPGAMITSAVWIPGAISSPGAVPAPSRPISVSAVGGNGRYRCTAEFPSSTLAPGAKTSVKVTVTNLSNTVLNVPEGAGNGVTASLQERSVSGMLLQDTVRMHDGIIGGVPMPQPVKPGATYDLPVYDAPLTWLGRIQTTVSCPLGHGGVQLGPVTLRVNVSGSAPSPKDAIAMAIAATSPAFDQCAPTLPDTPVIGLATGSANGSGPLVHARCEAAVIPRIASDIVILGAFCPPTGADYPLASLANQIAAVPQVGLTPPEELMWRTVFVTSDSAVVVREGTVSVGKDGYGTGGPFSPC